MEFSNKSVKQSSIMGGKVLLYGTLSVQGLLYLLKSRWISNFETPTSFLFHDVFKEDMNGRVDNCSLVTIKGKLRMGRLIEPNDQ